MAAAPSIMLLLLMLLPLPLVAGVALIIMSRRKGGPFPACGQCGYNISASIGTTTRCPECGGEFGEVGVRPTKARTHPAMLWIGLALVILPTTCIGLGVLRVFLAQRQGESQRAAAITAQAAAAQAKAQAQAQKLAQIQAEAQALAAASRMNLIALAQQALETGPAPDPALVERFRAGAEALAPRDARARLEPLAQELIERSKAGTIDDARAAELRAQVQALLDRLQRPRDLIIPAGAIP